MAKDGMKVLNIYQFQAIRIEDTFRLVARVLESKSKETCIDRDVMQSWEMIKNVLKEQIDTHVPRL
jgi:predicted transcriptional regulator